jgi:hypothetical protein
MAVSHAECQELVQLAGRQDRLLAVYQNRRCATAAAAAALTCNCKDVVTLCKECGWWVGSSVCLLSCCVSGPAAGQSSPRLAAAAPITAMLWLRNSCRCGNKNNDSLT